MGALAHTITPAGLVGDGLGSVFASGSLVGGGGGNRVYSQSSAAAKCLSLMHTRAVQIGGLGGLGLSPCPCFCGKFGKLWGPIARLSRQPIRRSLRSFQKLESRSQLPTDDDSEKKNSEGLESESYDDRISPSPSPRADAPSDGEGRGSRGQQPQPQPKIAYRLVTALASVGFVETAYLTWSKINGAAVTCGIGGAGSCSDVLDSSYATVFGIPLPFIGMVAYGTLAVLGGSRLLSNRSSSNSDWVEEEKLIRWLALGITAAMGTASVYFMYILIVKLEGASCAYCVSSAVLSLSLLLCCLRGFTGKDITKMAGLQVAVGALVVLSLSVAYDGYDLVKAQDLDLPFVEPEVVTSSSPRMISLAKHLQSVGARMYGAFWCSHCFEQKQMLGREAMKYVDYVECYPEGYRKGVPIAKACDEANIQGFPTWIIKGQILSGEQELDDLAKVSGFDKSQFK